MESCRPEPRYKLCCILSNKHLELYGRDGINPERRQNKNSISMHFEDCENDERLYNIAVDFKPVL